MWMWPNFFHNIKSYSSIFIFILSFLFSACGPRHSKVNIYAASNARACSVRTNNSELKTEILCPGQEPVSIPFVKDGRDGHSCQVFQLPQGAKIQCGDSTAYLYHGPQAAGACSPEYLSLEQLRLCIEESLFQYDGINPLHHPHPFAIKQIIDPCGPHSFHNIPTGPTEVIIRLNNGDLLGFVQRGEGGFLSVLKPGVYYSSDERRCMFAVDEDLAIVYSVQQYIE